MNSYFLFKNHLIELYIMYLVDCQHITGKELFIEDNLFISFQRAVWLNLPLNIFSTTITVLTGLVIYAYFASCDPRSIGEISKDDEVN